MSETHANDVKLLFIVSNDFGELSSSLYFATGQSFQVTLALPPRLYSIHSKDLHIPSLQYQSIEDVLEIVDRRKPDVVLLFSGYLFGVNGIFSSEKLSMLVSALGINGCRIVTSDPFLGLMTQASVSLFSGEHRKQIWLTEHFAQVAAALRGIVHLYPAKLSVADNHLRQSFFNEHIIVSQTQQGEQAKRLAELVPLRPERKRWVFLLSAEDYNLQAGRHGRQAFNDLLMRKMLQTSRAGRQPVLVAPQICIDGMGHIADDVEGAILLPFCQYELFKMLVHEAEYVFFWNIFSNSVLERVANGLPIVFFDLGHLAQSIPPLYRLGMETYYGDAPIPLFSQTQDLDDQSMIKIANGQKEPFARQIAKLRTLPSPAEVIRRILAS